jgi:superfamily II DNA helicase RecQ
LSRNITRESYEDAKLVIATVVQTGSKYGMKSVVGLLSPDIGLDAKVEPDKRKLPGYASGAHFPQDVWKQIIRQMVASGYLAFDAERFGAIVATQAGRDLLTHHRPVPLIGNWFGIKPQSLPSVYTSLAQGQRDKVPEAIRETFWRLHDLFQTELGHGEVKEIDLLRIVERRPSSIAELEAVTSRDVILRRRDAILACVNMKPEADLDMSFSIVM